MYPGGNLVKLSPSDLNASAYTEGDVIFAKHELKNVVASRGGCSILQHITMYVEGAEAADNFVLLFFDNDTDLGEPAADPASDITGSEFKAASCIGMVDFDGGISSRNVGSGFLYSTNHNDGPQNVFVKATFGFEYLG